MCLQCHSLPLMDFLSLILVLALVYLTFPVYLIHFDFLTRLITYLLYCRQNRRLMLLAALNMLLSLSA